MYNLAEEKIAAKESETKKTVVATMARDQKWREAVDLLSKGGDAKALSHIREIVISAK